MPVCQSPYITSFIRKMKVWFLFPPRVPDWFVLWNKLQSLEQLSRFSQLKCSKELLIKVNDSGRTLWWHYSPLNYHALA
jgi:hypothetical protein